MTLINNQKSVKGLSYIINQYILSKQIKRKNVFINIKILQAPKLVNIDDRILEYVFKSNLTYDYYDVFEDEGYVTFVIY